MAIKVNGKDMTDAVIKTDQFEMKILSFTPDEMKVSIKGTSGDSFTFVPRFITIVYPDTKVVATKDTGITAVRSQQTVEVTVQFAEKLHMERMMSFELRYSRRRLAEISIE